MCDEVKERGEVCQQRRKKECGGDEIVKCKRENTKLMNRHQRIRTVGPSVKSTSSRLPMSSSSLARRCKLL